MATVWGVIVKHVPFRLQRALHSLQDFSTFMRFLCRLLGQDRAENGCIITNQTDTLVTLLAIHKFFNQEHNVIPISTSSSLSGDSLEMSDHHGSFSTNKFLDCYHIFLLAAGTGFTPMPRIIQQCLHKLKKYVFFLKIMKIAFCFALQEGHAIVL